MKNTFHTSSTAMGAALGFGISCLFFMLIGGRQDASLDAVKDIAEFRALAKQIRESCVDHTDELKTIVSKISHVQVTSPDQALDVERRARLEAEKRATEVEVQLRTALTQQSAQPTSSKEVVTLPQPPEKFQSFLGGRDTTVSSVIIEIGLHSVVWESEKELNQHVIGIEASLRSIKNNLPLERERTTIVNVALSEESGVTEWFERGNWMAANSLTKQDGLAKYHHKGSELEVDYVTMIPVLRLEAILQKIPDSIVIALLKIDAQGHNFGVAAGAGMHIQRAVLVFTECTTEEGLKMYEQKRDLCTTQRSNYEKLGFTWLGDFIENPGDDSKDMAFVQTKHLDLVKSCFPRTHFQKEGPKDDTIIACANDIIAKKAKGGWKP